MADREIIEYEIVMDDTQLVETERRVKELRGMLEDVRKGVTVNMTVPDIEKELKARVAAINSYIKGSIKIDDMFDRRFDRNAARSVGDDVGKQVAKGMTEAIRSALNKFTPDTDVNLEKHIADPLQQKTIRETLTPSKTKTSQLVASKRESLANIKQSITALQNLTAEQKSELSKRNKEIDRLYSDEERADNEFIDQLTDAEERHDQVIKDLSVQMKKPRSELKDEGFYIKGKFVKTGFGSHRDVLEPTPLVTPASKEYGKGIGAQQKIPEPGPVPSRLPSRDRFKTNEEFLLALRKAREFYITQTFKEIFGRGAIDTKALSRMTKEQLAITTNENAPRKPRLDKQIETELKLLFNDPKYTVKLNEILKQAETNELGAIQEIRSIIEYERGKVDDIMPYNRIKQWKDRLKSTEPEDTGKREYHQVVPRHQAYDPLWHKRAGRTVERTVSAEPVDQLTDKFVRQKDVKYDTISKIQRRMRGINKLADQLYTVIQDAQTLSPKFYAALNTRQPKPISKHALSPKLEAMLEVEAERQLAPQREVQRAPATLVAFTGHRPNKLGGYDETTQPVRDIKAGLVDSIRTAIASGTKHFISGMALGADMWAAEAVLELKKEFPDIKLTAAVPFKGQERQWPKPVQERYSKILSQADTVKYISDEKSKLSISQMMQKRNQWMVDQADKMIAVFSGSAGGTANTIRAAKKRGIPVENVLENLKQPEQARTETVREAKKTLGPQYVPPVVPTTIEQTEKVVKPVEKAIQKPVTEKQVGPDAFAKIADAINNQLTIQSGPGLTPEQLTKHIDWMGLGKEIGTGFEPNPINLKPIQEAMERVLNAEPPKLLTAGKPTEVPDKVTLYRGGARKKEDSDIESTSNWFTDELERARGYAAMRTMASEGENKVPAIKTISVPSSLLKTLKDVGSHSPGHEFQLPPEIAKRAETAPDLLKGPITIYGKTPTVKMQQAYDSLVDKVIQPIKTGIDTFNNRSTEIPAESGTKYFKNAPKSQRFEDSLSGLDRKEYMQESQEGLDALHNEMNNMTWEQSGEVNKVKDVQKKRQDLIDFVKNAGVKIGLDIDETIQSMNVFSIMFGEESKGFLDPEYMNKNYEQWFEKLNKLSPIYSDIQKFLGNKSVLITARPNLVGLHDKAQQIGKQFGAIATFAVENTKEKAKLIKELGLETYYDEDTLQVTKLQKELDAIGATTKVMQSDFGVAREKGELPNVKRMAEQATAKPVTSPVKTELPTAPAQKPTRNTIADTLKGMVINGGALGGAGLGFLGGMTLGPLPAVFTGWLGANIGMWVDRVIKSGQLKQSIANLFNKTPVVEIPPTVVEKTTQVATGISDAMAGMLERSTFQAQKVIRDKFASVDKNGGTLTIEEAPGAEPAYPGAAVPNVPYVNPALVTRVEGSVTGIVTAMTTASRDIATAGGKVAGQIQVLGMEDFGSLGGSIKEAAQKGVQAVQEKMPRLGSSERPYTGGIRWQKFLDGTLFTDQKAYEEAVAAKIDESIKFQVDTLREMTGLSLEAATTLRKDLAAIIKPSRMKMSTLIGRAKAYIETKGATGTTPEALKEFATGEEKIFERSHPAMKNLVPEDVTPYQRMFGQDYTIKLSFLDYDEFMAAAETVRQLPGWTSTATKEFERYGQLGTNVLHTMKVTGHIPGGKEIGGRIEQVRTATETLATGPSAITERSQLEIGDKRLNLQERMNLAAMYLDKLNWKLVRGQMALLGIAFSMMGAIKMIQKAWSTVTTSMSNLPDIFKNIGMAMAFGPANAQGFLRTMLGSSNQIVGSWKKFTGYTATLNSMLAYFAFRLLQDTRVIFAIDRLVEKIIGLLSDQAFLDKIFGLIANIIDALPGAVDWIVSMVTWLMGILETPGMKDVLKWALAMGLAAQFLMTPLALLGGAVQFLGWAVSALAAILATVQAGWTLLLGQLMGAPAALTQVVAGIAGGIVLGLAAVWLLVKMGIIDAVVKIGEEFQKNFPDIMAILRIVLSPLALLGGIILELVTTGVQVFWDTLRILFDRGAIDAGIYLLQGLLYLVGRIANVIATVLVGVISSVMQLVVKAIISNIGLIPGVGSFLSAMGWDAKTINAEIGKVATSLTGGIGSLVDQFLRPASYGISSLPGRARGGKVVAGTPVIVGEEGPEVFVPSGSGDIIPNHMTGYADGTVDAISLEASAEKIEKGGSDIVYGAEAYKRIMEEHRSKNFDMMNRLIGNVDRIFWDVSTGTNQQIGMTNPNVPVTGDKDYTRHREQFLSARTQEEVRAMPSGFSGRYTELVQPIASAVTSIATGIHQSYSSLEEVLRLRKSLSSMGPLATPVYPHLASGGFVMQTGAAVVHKGERIIPAEEASVQSVQVTNYVTATVNNKTDEKYLLELMGRKYYSGAY